jgi:hypothetical protein
VRPSRITRAKFTTEDDALLRAAVAKVGCQNWDEISRQFGVGRTMRQILDRWKTFLNPRLLLTFRREDDHALLKFVAQFGPKWALISKFIGDKSDVSLRNRYAILMKANMVREVSRFGDLDDADSECSDIGQTDFLEEFCPFSNSCLNCVSVDSQNCDAKDVVISSFSFQT